LSNDAADPTLHRSVKGVFCKNVKKEIEKNQKINKKYNNGNTRMVMTSFKDCAHNVLLLATGGLNFNTYTLWAADFEKPVGSITFFSFFLFLGWHLQK
jgi:hypothetical protein